MFFTAVFVVFYQLLTPLYACDAFLRNGFDIRHREIQNRMFNGKRLSELNPMLLSKKVSTSMECLDACLRFDQCVSFDVEASPQQPWRICKIHGVVQRSIPLVEEENSINFNLSSELLQQILRSATDDCNGLGKDENDQLPLTQEKLDSYCATVAPNVEECSKNKNTGNCAGDWSAKILQSGWCCVDLSHPSQKCCCPIPQ